MPFPNKYFDPRNQLNNIGSGKYISKFWLGSSAKLIKSFGIQHV
jgi:hypothetical protein